MKSGTDSRGGRTRGETREQVRGQARGEATRNDIVQVARQLFSEHGYHNTGIADLQSATGLTKGAFYHHFASKEDVALAVLELAESDYAERMFGPAMEQGSALARAVAVLDGGVALNRTPEWCNCRLMSTLCTEMTQSDERIRERVLGMHERMYVLWADLLRDCEKEGALRDGMTPERGAQLVVSAIMGIMTARKLGNERFDLEGLSETLKQTLFLQSTDCNND